MGRALLNWLMPVVAGVLAGLGLSALSRLGRPDFLWWVIGGLSIACGISWQRARGGAGIIGGAVGGMSGGIVMVTLSLLRRPDELAILGPLFALCLAGVWWFIVGFALGLNVWLYLAKPFADDSVPRILHRPSTWRAIGFFSASSACALLAMLLAVT
jgi:hypothetical protein